MSEDPPGAFISYFCWGFITVRSHIFISFHFFLPIHVFPAACCICSFQQNIRKRESSSINIAPVFFFGFFFVFLSLWESGDWACAESLSLIFCASACLDVRPCQWVYLCSLISLFKKNYALCCTFLHLYRYTVFRHLYNYCRQTEPLPRMLYWQLLLAASLCIIRLDLVGNSQREIALWHKTGFVYCY